MDTIDNSLFMLEKMKDRLCLTSDGELFSVQHWEIETGTSIEKFVGIFSKKKVTEMTPTYVKQIQTKWSKHIGTTFVSVAEFTDLQTSERRIKNLYECRERYEKLSHELGIFGMEVAKKASSLLKAKVDEAIANGASAADIGKIVGEELGIC